MKAETKIWIWIAVAIIIVAGLSVGGYFLLKKDSSNDGGNKGGENGGFTPAGKGNGTSNGGSSKTTEEITTEAAEETKTPYIQAVKLKESIYGLGTDTTKLQSVFNSVQSQNEWNEILVSYMELTGNEFKKDIADEWGISKATIKNFQKIFEDKNIDPKF